MPKAGDSAGWYPNPEGPGERWWNGVSWSDAYRSGTGHRSAQPTSGALLGPSSSTLNPTSTGADSSGRGCLVGVAAVLIVAGVLITAALFAVRVGLGVPTGWTTTTGTVTATEVVDDFCYATASYEVDGTSYTVEQSVSLDTECDRIGTTVDVAYDPGNPGDARIPSIFANPALTSAALVSAVITAGLVLLVMTLRRRTT